MRRRDLEASIAALNSTAPNEPSLQDDVAKLRAAAGPGPLFDVAELRQRGVMLGDLMHEAGIRVLHDAILRWRVRCRQLELQVERIKQEKALMRATISAQTEIRDMLLAESAQIRDDRDRLERELAAVVERADKLQQAAEHARGFLEWGMGDGR